MARVPGLRVRRERPGVLAARVPPEARGVLGASRGHSGRRRARSGLDAG